MDEDIALEELVQFKQNLRTSVRILSGLNLYQSAKWNAECLNSVIEIDETQEQQFASNANSLLPIDPHESRDIDKILLANTYFNCREFDRCSFALKGCNSGNAIFLRLYSSYVSIEKKIDEQSENILSEKDTHSNLNPSLHDRFAFILKEIERFQNDNVKNPFLYYLSGLIYLKQRNFQLATKNLYNSLKIFPYNWSCWQDLLNSLSNFDEAIAFVNKLNSNPIFTNSIMFKFFKVIFNQEYYQHSNIILNNLDGLLDKFPDFNFLKVQKALISYHALDYIQAEKLFDDVLIHDPLRLDDLDIYSNILYVMEKKQKLSFLAQIASSIDNFRPETCCIIANYYSLKFEHEKAIMYYKRALLLNKNCLTAWTLMGHEFVELKNSHAAIESYRRAVDTNAKDFRAWYGLGQAYEVLDMHLYSLYYYQKATALQPNDKRMWLAMGNCFEKLNKHNESIKVYEKALSIEENDSFILFKLANLYELTGDINSCYNFMKLCLNQEMDFGQTDDTSKSRIWLARFEISNSNYAAAYEYAKDMNNGNSHDIEEARSIAREARSRME